MPPDFDGGGALALSEFSELSPEVSMGVETPESDAGVMLRDGRYS